MATGVLAPESESIGLMEAQCPLALVSVIVLTHNEEANLPACLESLRGLPCIIFVVDSGSSDLTVDIARAFGAVVVEHPFETHASQWHWALEHLPIATEWILALDADQRVTSELAAELQNLDASSMNGYAGVYIKRRQWFRDRWIKHGGYYPKYLLKLFRRDNVIVDADDLVDHHFYVTGPVKKLRHDLIESNKKEDDISFWIDKHNRYAALLACEEVRWRNRPLTMSIEPSLFGNPDQKILALKGLWRRMPLYVRPFLYFGYRYFLRLGFLDGKQGAVFHFMQAFWFRLVVDIKIDEMLRQGNRP